MNVAVLKESFPGERRVALVPAGVAPLGKAGVAVAVEAGAGMAAGFSGNVQSGSPTGQQVRAPVAVIPKEHGPGVSATPNIPVRNPWRPVRNIARVGLQSGDAQARRNITPCARN